MNIEEGFNICHITGSIGNRFHDDQVFGGRQGNCYAADFNRLRPGNRFLLKREQPKGDVCIDTACLVTACLFCKTQTVPMSRFESESCPSLKKRFPSVFVE